MFTGITNGIATIILIEKKNNIYTFVVKLSYILSKNLRIGDSIAYNGCCVTIKKINNLYVTSDIIQETLNTTNLKFLSIGDNINIERSVKYGDEIGGHIISGHIITTADIANILNNDDNYIIWLKLKNDQLMKYVFYKGFICIDGISLTVGKVVKNKFCVHITPYTLYSTTIGQKKIKDIMNIEVDFYTKTIVDTTERLIANKMSNTLLT